MIETYIISRYVFRNHHLIDVYVTGPRDAAAEFNSLGNILPCDLVQRAREHGIRKTTNSAVVWLTG